MTYYNNIPQPQPTPNSASATLQVFDTYGVAPLNIDATTYDAMVGFFTSRGFGNDSSESMSYVIIKHAISLSAIMICGHWIGLCGAISRRFGRAKAEEIQCVPMMVGRCPMNTLIS